MPLRRVTRLFRPYRWNLLLVGALVAASSLVSLANDIGGTQASHAELLAMDGRYAALEGDSHIPPRGVRA